MIKSCFYRAARPLDRFSSSRRGGEDFNEFGASRKQRGEIALALL